MPDNKPISPTSTKERIWEVLMKATVPIAMAVAATVISHEVRISKIEENRFTNVDGLRLEKAIRDYVSIRFPPEWLLEDIKEIKARLLSIEKTINGGRVLGPNHSHEDGN